MAPLLLLLVADRPPGPTAAPSVRSQGLGGETLGGLAQHAAEGCGAIQLDRKKKVKWGRKWLDLSLLTTAD